MGNELDELAKSFPKNKPQATPQVDDLSELANAFPKKKSAVDLAPSSAASESPTQQSGGSGTISEETDPLLAEQKLPTPKFTEGEVNTSSDPLLKQSTAPLLYEQKLPVPKSYNLEPQKEINYNNKDNVPVKYNNLPNDVNDVLKKKSTDKNFETFDGKYFIYSKENSNLYVFDSNHNLIDWTVGGRGKDKGDIPNRDNINDKNLSRHTTRAGSGVIASVNGDKLRIEKYGTPFYSISFNDAWKNSEHIGLHGIYKNEREFRESVLKNPQILDKLISNGCINVDPEWLNKNRPNVGDSIFITKEPSGIVHNSFKESTITKDNSSEIFHKKLNQTLDDLSEELSPLGYEPFVVSGKRTLSEQKNIPLSNTQSPISQHNFDNAADIWFKKDGVIVKSLPPEISNKIGYVGKKNGLYWGGDWRYFKDIPHLQLYEDSVDGLTEHPERVNLYLQNIDYYKKLREKQLKQGEDDPKLKRLIDYLDNYVSGVQKKPAAPKFTEEKPTPKPPLVVSGVVIPEYQEQKKKYPELDFKKFAEQTTDKSKLHQQAHELSASGRYAGSNAVLDIIEKKFPDDPYVNQLRSYNLGKLNNPLGVKNELDKAIAKNPTNVDLLADKAMADWNVDHVEDARKAATTFVVATKNTGHGDESIAKKKAQMYSILGDEKQAEYWNNTYESLKESRLTQQDAKTLQSLPDYLLTSPHFGFGLVGSAKSFYEGATKVEEAVTGEKEGLANVKPGVQQRFTQKLTPVERMVLALSGTMQAGMAAGSLTPVGTGVPKLMELTGAPKALQFTVGFLAPELAEFNLALKGAEMVLPSKLTQAVTAPMTTAMQAMGYDPEKMNLLAQEGISAMDMVGFIYLLGKAKKLGSVIPEQSQPGYLKFMSDVWSKYKNGEPMTPEEGKDVVDEISNADKDAFDQAEKMARDVKQGEQDTQQVQQVQNDHPEVKSYSIGSEVYPDRKSFEEALSKFEEKPPFNVVGDQEALDAANEKFATNLPKEGIEEGNEILGKNPQEPPKFKEPTGKESLQVEPTYLTDEKLPHLEDRNEVGNRPTPSVEQQINSGKKLIQELPDGTKVYEVDGELVRENIYPDFTMGGNDHAYPNFVPKGEVWIEKDMVGQTRETTLAHEVKERQLMSEGKTYEQAHEIALKEESKVRAGEGTPIEQMVEPKEGEGKVEVPEVTDFSKVASASSRFRPMETVEFEKPIIGKNGNQLVSYQWSYEWDMRPNREGEMVGYRKSNWEQAESSASTGRDIVHKFTIRKKDGSVVTVSSESVPVELGYVDPKEMKNFPNVVTAVKTLAKQRMQLSILEAQEKEYNELRPKYEKEPKPQVEQIKDPISFQLKHQEEGKHNVFSMGDVWVRQDNEPYRTNDGFAYKQRNEPTKETIKELEDKWVRKRIEEDGGKQPSEIYDLRKRIARQEKKVEEVTKSKTKTTTEEPQPTTLKTEPAKESELSKKVVEPNAEPTPQPSPLQTAFDKFKTKVESDGGKIVDSYETSAGMGIEYKLKGDKTNRKATIFEDGTRALGISGEKLTIFQKAADLYYKIMDAKGEEKRSLAERRRELIESDPKLKYIDDNIKTVTAELEEKGLLTKRGDCP